jgi:uncharacterized protein YjbI with pentapeptide repeats
MADFCRGFVYERDVPVPSALTIEGRQIKDFKETRRRCSATLPWGEPIAAHTLAQLVECYVDRTGALENRRAQMAVCLTELRKGADAWNKWRSENPQIQPMLAGVRADIDFKRRRLDGYDFSYTNFTQAKLRKVSFRNANFHQAILAGANLSNARLQGANFCRTDLYKTVFRSASLRGANLQGVQLAMTDLRNADLRECTIYGMSAWDLKVTGARQGKLTIRYQPSATRNGKDKKTERDKNTEAEVKVEGLDPAAFLYFALNNMNLSAIMNAANEKWVLILGRFTERRTVLDKVRDAVEKAQFIPIIFDFERPKHRDLIETIMLLAGMSAFVIVELTNPRSTPLELQAIAANYAVPIFPIIEKGAKPFGMFPGLLKFRWVHPPVEYRTERGLIATLRSKVIEPAMKERGRLAALRRRVEAS